MENNFLSNKRIRIQMKNQAFCEIFEKKLLFFGLFKKQVVVVLNQDVFQKPNCERCTGSICTAALS
jgi:hypothetical protein